MELHSTEQDPQLVTAAKKQTGDLTVSDQAEDRAGVRRAEENPEPGVWKVSNYLFRLIQKYQNFMKELENHHNQETVKYDKASKLQCNYHKYLSNNELFAGL